MSAELLVLGGERRAAADAGTFEVTEPATGGSMAEVAEAGPEDARRAVDIAVRAFEEGSWPRISRIGLLFSSARSACCRRGARRSRA